ncbi:MAG: UvrD-helicase domain-containing protein [Candidatus Cloacimonetes bacterium]|nr:UvrD-helicase domain-containing protein [Candidatus Cloacimonadota bacterium]
MLILNSPDDISLSHHGLIEASAGTGKTYTIENLVLRILKTTNFDLSQILLVTFTEKATGELKSRLRACIQDAIKEKGIEAQLKNKLIQNIRVFDQAPIFTIHGFCQQVSSEYSFENRTPLLNNIVSSQTLFEEAFHHLIQTKFEDSFKPVEQIVLELLNFEKWKIESDFISTGLYFDLKSIFTTIENCDTMQIGDQKPLKKIDIINQLQSIQINIDSQKSYFKRLISGPDLDGLKEKEQLKLTNFCNNFIEEKYSFSYINSVKVPGHKTATKYMTNLNLECPYQNIEDLKAEVSSLKTSIHIVMVEMLKTYIDTIKMERSQIVFQDMLVRLEKALEDPIFGKDLKIKLQKKYQLALVDEFQDTDPIQWNIFKTIFIDTKLNNKLLLVGDPKQAIYKFRGGDINTYLEAKNIIKDLSTKDQAKIYSLGTNYRSSSKLIEIFNQCFSPDYGDENSLWFAPDTQDSKNISYDHVKSPQNDNLETLVSDDRSALNLIEFEDSDSNLGSDDYLFRWCQFIKNEINYLYKNSPLVYQKNGKDSQNVSLNDICILTRSSKIGETMEKILLDANIPVAYYKRQNLYSSEIAFHLELLFSCILDPSFGNKNALKLTPFFDLQVYNKSESLFESPSFNDFLHESLELLNNHKWGKFKEKLLIETKYIQRYCQKIDFDFSFSILSQILEELEELAYSENLEFSMVLSRLKKFRVDGSGGEDLHRLATEKPKVQIMTMHVSKGLEFPIVFVLDKFSKSKPNRSIGNLYYDYDLKQRVFNLDKKHNQKLFDQQEQDETKRLYYVALTRASLRLYLPLAQLAPKDLPTPLRGWLSKRLHSVFSQESNHVSYLNYNMSHPQTDSNVNEKLIPSNFDYQVAQDHRNKSIVATSFSSLSRRIKGLQEAKQDSFSLIETQEHKADEAHETLDILNSEAQETTLPKGAQTGTMLHEIFEETDFTSIFLDQDIPQNTKLFINSQLQYYGLDMEFSDQIKEMIKNTLFASLDCVSDGFQLHHLQEQDKLVEADFWVPSDFAKALGRSSRAEYTRGAIDLIFRENDTYYILDWKSNFLEQYDSDYLQDKMVDAGYDLQYLIYSWCFLKWAHLRIPNFSNDQFGGVIYCFLRGMKANQSDGVFFESGSSLGAPEDLYQKIQNKLNKEVSQ